MYDPANRLTAIINANNYTTTFAYDDNNRKINETDADGGVRTTTYDPVGNVLTSLDPRGMGVTASYYDYSNRLTGQTYNDLIDPNRSYSYDAVGNRLTATNALGTYTSTYDPRNMLSTLEEPSSKTVVYHYDAAGRRTDMDAYTEGTFTYNWDAANRQTSVVAPGPRVTTLAYDPLARVTHQTYASGATTSQTYDAAGNLSQITHSNDGGLALVSQLTYAYNAANQRTLQTEYDGTQTAWTYDGKYQLTNEYQTGTPTGLSWSTLTTNQWAELTVAEWAALPVNPPTTGVGYNLTHTYDPAGNRTVMNATGTITTYTYTPANRLTLANAAGTLTTYTNDTAGNRLTMQQVIDGSEYTTYYTWDAAGRMIGATPSTGDVAFRYNADNQRVLKESGSATTRFLYDYKKLLAETDNDSGDLISLYSTTSDGEYGNLIDELSGEATHLYDAQANTNALIDPSGSVLAQYKYYAFGNISAYSIDGAPWSSLDNAAWNQMTIDQWNDLAPGTDGSIKMLAGGQKQYYLDQETSFYLLGAGASDGKAGTYLDPSTIRRNNEDPIRQASGDDNLYPIVESNPINKSDPSGHVTRAQLEELGKDQPAQIMYDDGFSWDVVPPLEENKPKVGDSRVITLPNGLTYYGQITNVAVSIDTDYLRWTWGGLPTTYTLTYKETFTRKGSGYAEQAESNYRAGIQNYISAVEQLHETGKEIVNTVASFNPIVSAITIFKGEDASGDKVSGGERVLAGANIIPAEEVFTSVLALLSALKKLREAKVLKSIDLVYKVEHAVDEASKLRALDELRKVAPTPELEAEARLYSVALDPDKKELTREGIQAAIQSSNEIDVITSAAADGAAALPEGVRKAEDAQYELVRNQQKQLIHAIDNAPAGEKAAVKGRVLQEQGAQAEIITHGTLDQIPGATLNKEPVKIGKGEGSEIDHLVSRGSKKVYVETKLTITEVNQRTVNQLTNAAKVAQIGDSVFLQVARMPTKIEIANLRKALGPDVSAKVKIYSKQTDLFNAVMSALQ